MFRPGRARHRDPLYGTHIDVYGHLLERHAGYLFDGTYLLISEDGITLTQSRDVAFLASGKFWVNNHAHVVKTLGLVELTRAKLDPMRRLAKGTRGSPRAMFCLRKSHRAWRTGRLPLPRD